MCSLSLSYSSSEITASSDDSQPVSPFSEPFPREAETGLFYPGVQTPSDVSDLIVIGSDLMVRALDSPRDWDSPERTFHRPGWDDAHDVERLPSKTTRASSSDVNAFEDFLSAQDPRAQEGLFRMTEAAGMFDGYESDYEPSYDPGRESDYESDYEPLYWPITPPDNSYDRFSPESSDRDSDCSCWGCQELPQVPLTGPLRAEADIREFIRQDLDEELRHGDLNHILMAARNGEFFYNPLEAPPWRDGRTRAQPWDVVAWLHLWFTITQLEIRVSDQEHIQYGRAIPQDYVDGIPTISTWLRRENVSMEDQWWLYRKPGYRPLAYMLEHGVPLRSNGQVIDSDGSLSSSIPDITESRCDYTEIPYGWRAGDPEGYNTEDPDTWDVTQTTLYPILGARHRDRSQMDNPYFRFVDYRGGYNTDDSDMQSVSVPSSLADSDEDMDDYDGDEDEDDDQRELEGEFGNHRPMTMLTSSWNIE